MIAFTATIVCNGASSRAGRISNGYEDADLKIRRPVAYQSGHFLYYGASVAVDSGIVLIGDQTTPGPGVAFLHDSNSGRLLHTLTPAPFGKPAQGFGRHAAMRDGYAVVSANESSYVYDIFSGDLLHELPVTPGYLAGSQAIAIQGGHVVIASLDSVTVFELASGEEVANFAELRVPTVAIHNERLVVGRGREGLVTVLDWQEHEVLYEINGANLPDDSYLGMSLAANGSYLLAGAQRGAMVDGVPSRTVYTFDIESGGLLHALTAPSGEEWRGFAADIALHNDTGIISANRHGDRFQLDGETRLSYEFNQGAAFAFSLKTGEEIGRFTSLAPESSGRVGYGFAIDYDGEQLVAGSLGGWPATVYVTNFAIPEPPSLLLVFIAVTAASRRCRRSKRSAIAFSSAFSAV